MPPPDKKPRLAAADIAKLERWIAGGAKYEAHWSFIAPVASAAKGKGSAIDSAVAARLRREGLSPAPEADAATLARRLYLDVIGSPHFRAMDFPPRSIACSHVPPTGRSGRATGSTRPATRTATATKRISRASNGRGVTG